MGHAYSLRIVVSSQTFAVPQLEGCILHSIDAEGIAEWDPATVQACASQVIFRERIEEPVGVF